MCGKNKPLYVIAAGDFVTCSLTRWPGIGFRHPKQKDLTVALSHFPKDKDYFVDGRGRVMPASCLLPHRKILKYDQRWDRVLRRDL